MMPNQQKLEKKFIDAYDNHSEAIFRHCYYRVFDQEMAKDFMQEAYSRTWQYIVKGNDIENIRAFLYRTANNIIIDESRKKKNVSLNEVMEKGFEPKDNTRQSTEDYFTSKEVLAIIHSLDEKYRNVVLLKYIDGFSSKEIAQMTGEKENNIYIRLHRGLEKIRSLMDQQNQTS